MSPHVLTIFLFFADGTATETRMGVMASEALCDVTGRSLVASLSVEDPSIQVGWTCEPAGVST